MQPRQAPSPRRVLLRPAMRADAAQIKIWRNEPSVRRFQPLGEVSVGQIRAELVNQSLQDLHTGRGDKFQWIVLDGEESVGWITLVVNNWDHGLGEIGYSLTTSHQGRGLMPQALPLLLDEIFLNTSLQRVEARCAVGNDASARVLEAVGFRREGLLREYFVLHGERVDNYLYAILRRDYLPSGPERP